MAPPSSTPANAFTIFKSHIATLQALEKSLPSQVPVGKKVGQIGTVFKNIPESTNPTEHWGIFNRRMDALYGEDLRKEGDLPNIVRGKWGIRAVCEYLERCVDAGSLSWDIAILKTTRLIGEVEKVCKRHAATGTAKIAAAKRKARVDDESDEDDGDYAPPKHAPAADDDDMPTTGPDRVNSVSVKTGIHTISDQ
ncbi:hypothetical protein DFP72DRAFT_859159 [Ephemerocybe angulata]|uniref:Uncharacterized protein n=1 Tax=Ephemerocybe angulata TaxID=980116 RepID=A0A8H6HBS7_9AGAR|nr:hypothetical protein DFP72DRAFT_859159 [Tulosesus angulatus]